MRLGEIRIGNKSRRDTGIDCGRPGVFGNPYTVEEHGRKEAIQLFEDYARKKISAEPNSDLAKAFKQLSTRLAHGESVCLVCHCAPKPCHAEVVGKIAAELAQELLDKKS